jgi:alpha-galactosidase
MASSVLADQEPPNPQPGGVASYLRAYSPNPCSVHASEVQDGRFLVKQFAPSALSQVIVEKVPLQLAIADKVFDLQLHKAGPSLLEGSAGDLRVNVDYDYLEDPPALRWTVTVRNEGGGRIENVTLTPLLLTLSVDSYRDQHRVRHLGGSRHFDATYPPRAFRLSEERFITHDHCEPVRIESSLMGSAWDHVPVLQFAIGRGRFTGLFAGFEWSSRWYLEARWARYSFRGEPPPNFLLEGNVGLERFSLDPGELLTFPRVHMGFFEGEDWGACDNAVRRYVQEALSAKLAGRVPLPPVSYDHWFGLFNDFDAETLKREADRAAELGCEYFCLDAGWYPIRQDFGDGIGNWYTPEPKKFPHGVEEVSEHVRSLGMGFGIWHIIELAAPGSQVLQKHPELYLDHPSEPGWWKRLRTDLPEGRELALEIIRKWIRDWNMTWMRWEYNDPALYTYPRDPSGKLNLAHMNGVYQIHDTLRAEFPDLYIEGCQGGATRMDWGFAVRTHGTWLDDHSSNPEVCRFMQTGASRFWPAHYLNSCIRVDRNSGDSEANTHKLLSRMVGTMSFNGDIAHWSPAATELAKKHIRVYKQIRHLLDQSVVFPIPQPHSDRDWDVIMVADRKGENLLLYAFRLEGPDSLQISVPQGRWQQLLGSDQARLEQQARGTLLRLERNSSALWALGIG